MTKIKAPFFEIGPKSYLYGDEILELAKAADAASEKYNVDIKLSTTAKEIRENGILLQLPDGSEQLLECDTVIYATGQRPLWDAAKALAPCAPEFYQLGDCVTQKNVFQATQTAAHVARNIGRF